MDTQQPTAPAAALVQQLIGTKPTIGIVTSIDRVQNLNPHLLVIGAEKSGKSTLSTSLFGWPEPHMQPLILAYDKTGVDACLKMGYAVHAVMVPDMPGQWLIDKTRACLSQLEQNIATIRQTYGSLVVDCGSTMTDSFLDDARRKSNNPDSRSWYKDMGVWANETMNRIKDLGLPTIWLSWLKPPYEGEDGKGKIKRVRLEMGTAQIPGQEFKSKFVGKAHHILCLDKFKVGVGQPGADDGGYLRQLHTRPWENINCSGRYEHMLPEPCPANLSFVLSKITGRGPYA